jgi:hypothetical protein
MLQFSIVCHVAVAAWFILLLSCSLQNQGQPRVTHITKITRGNYNSSKENRITVQQNPSPQQLVHVKMAS